MAKTEYISQAEFSRRKEVSRAAVTKALKQDPPRIKLSSNGKLEWYSQSKKWDETAEPRSEMDEKGKPKDKYREHRTRKADFDARMKELEYKEKQGLLIRKSLVEKTVTEAFLSVRNSLVELSDRLDARISAIWMESVKDYFDSQDEWELDDEFVKKIIEIPSPELARDAVKDSVDEILKRLQEVLSSGYNAG